MATLNFTDFGMDTASLAGALEAKLAAIRAAGFTQVMLSACDVVSHPQGTPAAIAAIRQSGLRVTGLEALRDFEGLTGRLHAYKIDVAKGLLELTHAVGARLLVVEASTSTHASRDIDVVVADLRKLALLAVPLGIRIAYKGTTASRSTDAFIAASDIVLHANCPNLGLALDSFDIFAAKVPEDEIEMIDPEQIFLVQLSDFMWTEIRSAEEQATTATHFRVFPGEGAHTEGLADFVTRLDRIGYYGDYSLDVYNDDYLQLPPERVADRARRSAVWLGETVLRRALAVPNIERLRSYPG
jgi:sugar phosphate isomerase/epimerase